MEIREAYMQKVSAQLKQWQAWIEVYHPPEYPASSAVYYLDSREMSERLQQRYQAACNSLETLHNSSHKDWKGAKDRLERAMVDLKIALDESGAGRTLPGLAVHAGRAHAYAPFSRKN